MRLLLLLQLMRDCLNQRYFLCMHWNLVLLPVFIVYTIRLWMKGRYFCFFLMEALFCVSVTLLLCCTHY